MDVDFLVVRLAGHVARHHAVVAAPGNRRPRKRPRPRIGRLRLALNPAHEPFAQFDLRLVDRAGQLAEVIGRDDFDADVAPALLVEHFAHGLPRLVDRDAGTRRHGRHAVRRVLAGARRDDIGRPLLSGVEAQILQFALALLGFGGLGLLEAVAGGLEELAAGVWTVSAIGTLESDWRAQAISRIRLTPEVRARRRARRQASTDIRSRTSRSSLRSRSSAHRLADVEAPSTAVAARHAPSPANAAWTDEQRQ